MKKCLTCDIAIESNRKRCKVCAYDHHKKMTAEHRRVRTTLIYGWDVPRICKDCGGQYIDDRRNRQGSARTRCSDCWNKRYGPRPDRNCQRCLISIPANRRYCSDCAKIQQIESRKRSASKRPRKPPVICTQCGDVSINRKEVCSPCGKAARKREISRLRSFRDRLFTTLVHTPEDVEFILSLLDSPCEYCGSTDEITIEHRVPLIRGGVHNRENLTAACRACNCQKQSMTDDEFRSKVSSVREHTSTSR